MQVIGNLGKDCVTNLVNGKNVINFNVAHTEKFRDAQGNPVKRSVVVGLKVTAFVEIKSGLSVGETVVTSQLP